MSFWARMLRRRGYRVSHDKLTSSFVYREGRRRIRVSAEDMADGLAVYSSSIRQWESAPADVVDDSERQRIAANIRQYYLDRGKKVYLS